MRMNVEQNISDALLTMPKMAVGLDVNVRFGGFVSLSLSLSFSFSPVLFLFFFLSVFVNLGPK